MDRTTFLNSLTEALSRRPADETLSSWNSLEDGDRDSVGVILVEAAAEAFEAASRDPSESGEVRINKFIDRPPPERIRRRFPRFDLHAPIIMAWAGRWRQSHTGWREEATADDILLSWGNRTLQHFLANRLRTDSQAEPTRLRRVRLQSYAAKLWTCPGDERSRDDSAPTLSDFFDGIGADDPTRELLRLFTRTLMKVPEAACGLTLGELVNQGGSYTHALGTSGVESFWSVFRQEHDGTFALILGARALPLGGVRLAVAEDAPNSEARWVDLVGVWRIKFPEAGKPLRAEDFESVQGVLIPVENRRRLYDRLRERNVWNVVAGLVARNFSHNLGSHALLHYANDLSSTAAQLEADGESGAAEEKKQLARLLDYLTGRADLIAIVAGGATYGFHSVRPLARLLEDFQAQKILRENLCRTEGGLEVGVVAAPPESAEPELFVDLPGGIVGAHALFAILENTARNSAKHSPRSNAKRTVELRLTATLLPDVDLVKVCLVDDASSAISERKIGKLRRSADARFVLGEGVDPTVDGTILGIKEMRAWTAILRGLDLPSVDDLNLHPHPLLGFEQEEETDRLVTVFYLLPSREAVRLVPVPDEDYAPHRGEFALVVCPERYVLRSSPMPSGRWVGVAMDPGEGGGLVRTPWGEHSIPAAEARAAGAAKDAELAATAQNWWVRGLAGHVLGGRERSVALVVQDPFLYKDYRNEDEPPPTRLLRHRLEMFDTGLPGVRGYLMDGSSRDAGGLDLSDRIADSLDEELIAVWSRHSEMGRIGDGALADRLIHYEGFDGQSDYDPLLRSLFAAGSRVWSYLLEAALSQILVVDERLAELFRAQPEVIRSAMHAGIILLDPADPAYVHDWSRKLDSIPAALPGRLAAQRRLPIVYETIHASLDRFEDQFAPSGSDRRTWADFLQDRADGRALSLHSGKGGVNEARELNHPFFPVSQISRFGFAPRCKLMLTSSLFRGGRFE